MFKFGFEIEGFHKVDGSVKVPPKGFSTDDFPGLCEVRNNGGGLLVDQLYLLKAQMDQYPSVDWTLHEHKFLPSERSVIRSRHYEKGGVSINNIYGKAPRDIGSRTLASFQINISNFQFSSKDGHVYGPFDFVEIIREFDLEFKDEIKESNRQPGFYAVKDDVRVEYRSLPNFVFSDPVALIHRIKKCV